MKKEEIISKIKTVGSTTARNRMGCDESWYDSFYALKQTFDLAYLESMNEKELNDLVKLADAMSEAFW